MALNNHGTYGGASTVLEQYAATTSTNDENDCVQDAIAVPQTNNWLAT